MIAVNPTLALQDMCSCPSPASVGRRAGTAKHQRHVTQRTLRIRPVGFGPNRFIETELPGVTDDADLRRRCEVGDGDARIRGGEEATNRGDGLTGLGARNVSRGRRSEQRGTGRRGGAGGSETID